MYCDTYCIAILLSQYVLYRSWAYRNHPQVHLQDSYIDGLIQGCGISSAIAFLY